MSDARGHDLISTDDVLLLYQQATGRRIARRTFINWVSQGKAPEPVGRGASLVPGAHTSASAFDRSEIEQWLQGLTIDEGMVTTDQVLSMYQRATGRTIASKTLHLYVLRGQAPAPVRRGRRGKGSQQSLFDRSEIEQWLAGLSEDRRAAGIRQAQEAIHDAVRQADDEALHDAVRAARKAGLTWRQIAEAIPSRVGDGHISFQAVQRRFRHVDQTTDE